MNKLKFRKGIFLVVFRKENEKIFYLLLKRKMHWHGWECVKGGVEKRESLRQAIKRELREEAGLRAGKIINMNKNEKFLYPPGFRGWPGFKGMIYWIFALETNSKKIKIDRIEHSGYKWLEYKKAYKKLTFNEQKRALKLVNSYLIS